MTKSTDQYGNIKFELEPSDVESAIRDFICHCHPETAKGFVIEVSWPDFQDTIQQVVRPTAIAHKS